MIPIQFDLFRDPQEQEIIELRRAFREVRESADKVRKGLFARHNELGKMYLELSSRLEIIERNICRGSYEKQI